MSFFWKYTRSGKISQTYLSFIIDVPPSFLFSSKERVFWSTSFEELEAFLILLQDIELINNPKVGTTKAAYASFVNELGFVPSQEYQVSGNQFHVGVATMGTHPGPNLPWGFVDDAQSPIQLDVTHLDYSAFPDATTGKIPFHSDDKLLPFRKHSCFERVGNYWDYMPKHSCVVLIFSALFDYDPQRAYLFVRDILRWREMK